MKKMKKEIEKEEKKLKLNSLRRNLKEKEEELNVMKIRAKRENISAEMKEAKLSVLEKELLNKEKLLLAESLILRKKQEALAFITSEAREKKQALSFMMTGLEEKEKELSFNAKDFASREKNLKELELLLDKKHDAIMKGNPTAAVMNEQLKPTVLAKFPEIPKPPMFDPSRFEIKKTKEQEKLNLEKEKKLSLKEEELSNLDKNLKTKETEIGNLTKKIEYEKQHFEKKQKELLSFDMQLNKTESLLHKKEEKLKGRQSETDSRFYEVRLKEEILAKEKAGFEKSRSEFDNRKQKVSEQEKKINDDTNKLELAKQGLLKKVKILLKREKEIEHLSKSFHNNKHHIEFSLGKLIEQRRDEEAALHEIRQDLKRTEIGKETRHAELDKKLKEIVAREKQLNNLENEVKKSKQAEVESIVSELKAKEEALAKEKAVHERYKAEFEKKKLQLEEQEKGIRLDSDKRKLQLEEQEKKIRLENQRLKNIEQDLQTKDNGLLKREKEVEHLSKSFHNNKHHIEFSLGKLIEQRRDEEAALHEIRQELKKTEITKAKQYADLDRKLKEIETREKQITLMEKELLDGKNHVDALRAHYETGLRKLQAKIEQLSNYQVGLEKVKRYLEK